MITKEDLYELLEEHAVEFEWSDAIMDMQDWTDAEMRIYDDDGYKYSIIRADLEGLAAALNRLVADRAKRGISDSNERLQDALEGARMQVREENLDFACDGAELPKEGKYEDQTHYVPSPCGRQFAEAIEKMTPAEDPADSVGANMKRVYTGRPVYSHVVGDDWAVYDMSLREFVEQLPEDHSARQQWSKLMAEVIGSYEQVDKALSHVEDAASSLKEQAKKHAGY